MDHQEFARDLHIDMTRLRIFINRGWISPIIQDGRPIFREVDRARAELIADLANEMGINDDGVDVVLSLVDQLYSLRCDFSNLIDALEAQPQRIRHHVVKDVKKSQTG